MNGEESKEKEKASWGGPGRSPGRLKRFGEESTILRISVPASKEEAIKRLFNKYLDRFDTRPKKPGKKQRQRQIEAAN